MTEPEHHQQILIKLENMSTTQTLRHDQNKEDVNNLFGKVKEVADRVNDLPCAVHAEQIKTNKESVLFLKKVVIGTLIASGMIGGIAGAATKLLGQ